MKLDHFALALLEAAPDAVIVTDAGGAIVLMNQQAETLLGAPRAQFEHCSIESLVADEQRAVDATWSKRDGKAFELLIRRKNNVIVPVEVSLAPVIIGGDNFSIAVLRDLTERRRLEEHLRFVSNHDALTGLSNRAAFENAVAHFQVNQQPIGVVMVDLDELKRINDEEGHAEGDAMIRRTAEVLRASFRSSDVVARIGGDEFVVLTSGRDAASIEMLATRLEDAVQEHNARYSTLRPLKLSIGVAMTHEGMSLERALQTADARMYSMKRAHRPEAFQGR